MVDTAQEAGRSMNGAKDQVINWKWRHDLWAKASRRFSPASYREHGQPASENLLKQDFYRTRSRVVTSPTFAPTKAGFILPGHRPVATGGYRLVDDPADDGAAGV